MKTISTRSWAWTRGDPLAHGPGRGHGFAKKKSRDFHFYATIAFMRVHLRRGGRPRGALEAPLGHFAESPLFGGEGESAGFV